MTPREEWLAKAVVALADGLFKPIGYNLNPARVRVYCGRLTPASLANRIRGAVVLGRCWPRLWGPNIVVISPAVSYPVRVLDVLTHELIHAYDNCASGHRGLFVKVARAVGLNPPWSRTTASEALSEHLTRVAEGLGPYPPFGESDVAEKQHSGGQGESVAKKRHPGGPVVAEKATPRAGE